MVTIAIANQKGGVGKTATAHALGEALAAMGRKVLLVDIDPQASLTQSCGIFDTGGRSLAEVLGGAQPGRLAMGAAIVEVYENLSLAPADIALAGAELGLTSRLGRENVLRKALDILGRRFDIALIDCPPSLGLLTVAALVAADAVLIPTQPQAADLRGLRLFMDTLEQIRAELNPGLEILGVLVTFYDRRYLHHRAAIEAMSVAGLPLLPIMILRSVRVAEAAGGRQSIVTYRPDHPQAAAYNELAEIVYRWQKNKI